MTGQAEVLHADDALVVVAKPAGLATIRERDPTRPCLHRALEELRGERLWIVHRIDKETSGLVLFARNAVAHRELSLRFEHREVHKVYRAVVHGDPGASGQIDDPLRSFGSGRTGVDPARGRPATTRWRRLADCGDWTVLEVQPLTGRRHQIRAHLCAAGHPVVGDPLYGSPEQRSDPGRMLLHAEQLGLEYPAGHERAWSCPPGPDFLDRLRPGA